MAARDQRHAYVSDSIRTIPDYPKPGIQFQDVTTILLDPKAFQTSIDLFVEHYKDQSVDVIAGAHRPGQGRAGQVCRTPDAWCEKHRGAHAAAHPAFARQALRLGD